MVALDETAKARVIVFVAPAPISVRLEPASIELPTLSMVIKRLLVPETVNETTAELVITKEFIV